MYVHENNDIGKTQSWSNWREKFILYRKKIYVDIQKDLSDSDEFDWSNVSENLKYEVIIWKYRLLSIL